MILYVFYGIAGLGRMMEICMCQQYAFHAMAARGCGMCQTVPSERAFPIREGRFSAFTMKFAPSEASHDKAYIAGASYETAWMPFQWTVW